VAAERRLVVDWPACKAHGVCAELLPELVGLDEWGYPLIMDAAVPRALISHAQRAVTACPTLALSLIEGPKPTPATTTRRRH
jgi:ferredoxin